MLKKRQFGDGLEEISCIGIDRVSFQSDNLKFHFSSPVKVDYFRVYRIVTHSSVAIHYYKPVVSIANQMTGFYMKCNTGLKQVKSTLI